MRIILSLFVCSSLFLLSSCAAVKMQKAANQNKETIRLWYEEGWNHNRNEELIERCFAPDWEDGNPLMPDETSGHAGILNLVKQYRIAFPEARFNISHLYADGNFVTVRYEVTAIHGAEAFGVAPTGKKFSTTGIVLYEMEHGKIKRSWQELDVLTILNQIK